MPPTESRNRKIQYGRQAAIWNVTLLKINRLLPYTQVMCHWSFGRATRNQTEVKVLKQKNPEKKTSLKINRLLPQTWIWNLKFQSNLELRSGNHETYRRTDGRADTHTHTTPIPHRIRGSLLSIMGDMVEMPSNCTRYRWLIKTCP